MKSSLLQAVRELSPGERNSLFKRIRTQPISEESASLEGDLEYMNSLQTPLEEIAEELQKDFKAEGFWQRLLLRLFSSFTARPLLQTYRDYRINQLLHSGARGSLQPLLDLNERKVKTIVFRKIYQIYRQAKGLMPFFSCSLIQEEGIISIVFDLLDNKILNPKETLSDFFDDKEILELLNQERKTDSSICEIISAKVNSYLGGIHPQVFQEIEKRLESFMLTRFFVFLPYHVLMRPFVGDVSIKSKNEEELLALAKGGASFDNMAFPLEKLASHLDAYCQVVLDFELFNRTFDLYNEEASKNTEEFPNFSQESLANKVLAFYNSIKLFYKTIPIATFMKIFKQDPYYELKKVDPRVNIQVSDFYAKMLESSLLAEWKISTKEIAQRHWLKEVENFFSADVIKLIDKPPCLWEEETNLKSWGEVVLLHCFLEKYGDTFFSYFLRTLMHVVLVNKVFYRNEIEVQEATLSEFSKIERINYNNFFKECREFHKRLSTFSSEADRIVAIQRWLALVEERNEKMLEEFYDYFRRLRKIFGGLQKNPELTNVLSIAYTLNNRKLTISEALEVCVQTINKYLSLVEIYRLKSSS